MLEGVAFDPVVPDDSVIRDLMKDPCTVVVDDHVVFIEGADVVVVGPQAVSMVVVDIVTPHDEVRRFEEFGATCFPPHCVIVAVIVKSNFVAFN